LNDEIFEAYSKIWRDSTQEEYRKSQGIKRGDKEA
jgi:hypothetical protein